MVRSVTRQIEPEYDDATRARVEGLARYDDECCPGCHLHKSILADPKRHRFTFDDDRCEVCKAQDIYGRVLARKDERALKRLENAPPMVPRPTDGRHTYLRPLTEAEREKARDHGESPRKRPS